MTDDMTIDDLYNEAVQETGNAASQLQQKLNVADGLTRDDWFDYWSKMGMTRAFCILFGPTLVYGNEYTDSMYDRMYPADAIDDFVEKYAQMTDVVLIDHSDIHVEKNHKFGSLWIDIAFNASYKHNVIRFLVSLWKLCGTFSSRNSILKVEYWSRYLNHQNAVQNAYLLLTDLRYVPATLDAMRKNAVDWSVPKVISEKEISRMASMLFDTRLFDDDVTLEDITRLIVEHIRKSLILREGLKNYLPAWTDNMLNEVMKYNALVKK